ncbi:MAG: fumarylacetoacetate hydrolase family protein [Chloroflexi bacterium]|nr:fumarylacetoacetate hydrolase family protein [Chloroflexota bacterium]
MPAFKLAAVERQGQEIAALVVDERLYPLDELAPERRDLQVSAFGLLQHWDAVLPSLRALTERVDGQHGGYGPNDPTFRLLSPIRYPRAIFRTIFNYYDFAAQVGVEPPDRATAQPYVTTKLPHTVIGPNDTIVLPDTSRQVDWGVELGAAIGAPCRDVFVKDALEYVAGYTIVNGISARDQIARPDWPNFGSDWLLSQNFDTSTPIGPYLLPRELLPDPQNVRLRLSRNGVVQQDGTTASMIFSVAEQIAFISSILTLLPGDVVATGTPAGVGWKRGLGLEPNDEVLLEIPEIGRLFNRVIGPLTMANPSLGTAYV